MSSAPLPSPSPLLVACLCAQWCDTCEDYRPLFAELALKFPQVRFAWVDIEDEAELVDPVEVENFPTILIASPNAPLFFGTVLPHIQTLQRLLESHQDGNSTPLTEAALVGLVRRLWQRPA